jgi:hypothetical protein
MALTRTMTLYSGSDASPVLDYTDVTDWTQTELGATANLGEASAGQWLVRDETGEIPNRIAPGKFLSSHNVVVATVGSNTLFRGRVAAQEHFRGRQKAERAAEWNLTLEDQNSHLRGIIVHNWVRGGETDAARAQALVAGYLSGSPRVTTNLNGSNLIITGSNAIFLPAKTYSGVTPFEIMSELASNADKEFFVTVDNELAYFGHDYTGYASLLRISDSLADANATTYAPWDPRSNEVGRDELTALRVYYGTDAVQQSVRLADAGQATLTDYWEDVYWDSESVTATQAAARAQKMLDYRANDSVSFSCSIGPMAGDEIWKVKPGQQIQFKSRGARGGRTSAGTWIGDQFITTRVRELRWITPVEDQYIARLELERPRVSRPGRGSKALATQPHSAPSADPGTPEGATLYKFFDADDGGDTLTWTGILSNQTGGAEGSGFYYFKSSAPNNYSTSFAATAGTIYRFTGYTSIHSGNNLKVAFRNDAAGSTGAITDANAVVLEVDILASGVTSTWTPFASVDITAPVGTTSMSLGRGGSSCAFDRVRIFTVTPGSPSSTTDPYAVDDPGTSPYYARSDDPRFQRLQDEIDQAVSTGWAPYASMDGISDSTNLAAGSTAFGAVAAGLGGALAVPIFLHAKMLLRSYSLWNADTANARAAEARLYVDDNASGTMAFVTGTDAAWSFTPSAASLRTAAVSGAPVTLGPGVYWLVIRNTSATQTFGIGHSTAATGDPWSGRSKINNATKEAALGATIDLTAAAWSVSAVSWPIVMNGSVFGESTAF